jgi:hypothetical protein
MRTTKILFAITLLALASLACGIDVDLPITTDVITGPEIIDQITIPYLEDPNTTALVTLNFGAGELFLSPGAEGALINGETTYNVEDLKPDISIDNEIVKIKAGSLDIDGFPRLGDEFRNIWDLSFSSTPIDLTIRAGAYVGDFELGDLSLVNLHIADGASEVTLNFEKPNRIEMGSLRYETGASNIKLTNLANANFNTMIFESGAGNYDLDFSGQLLRDANVFIETGLSTMTISVPKNMNVDLRIEGSLTNVSDRGSWEQAGDSYIIAADGPILRIVIEMNAGNLILKNP